MDFLSGSDDKESACSTGDPGSIPGSGRFQGEGNGYPSQRSCLENSRERVTLQATVPGIVKYQTQLNDQAIVNTLCLSAVFPSWVSTEVRWHERGERIKQQSSHKGSPCVRVCWGLFIMLWTQKCFLSVSTSLCSSVSESMHFVTRIIIDYPFFCQGEKTLEVESTVN